MDHQAREGVPGGDETHYMIYNGVLRGGKKEGGPLGGVKVKG